MENTPNPYAKYSGMAMQLLCTIGFGVWLGMKLDAWQQNKNPWWTISLSLIFTVGALVSFVKGISKNQS